MATNDTPLTALNGCVTGTTKVVEFDAKHTLSGAYDDTRVSQVVTDE